MVLEAGLVAFVHSARMTFMAANATSHAPTAANSVFATLELQDQAPVCAVKALFNALQRAAAYLAGLSATILCFYIQ